MKIAGRHHILTQKADTGKKRLPRKGLGLLITILFIAVFTGNVSAQRKPARVEAQFEGNVVAASDELSRVLRSRQLLTFAPGLEPRIAEGLEEYYRSEGYYLARVLRMKYESNEDSTRVTLFVTIDEGKLVLVGAVEMRGDSALTEEQLQRAMETSIGDVFSAAVLQEDIGRLLTLYENSGYPFTAIAVEDIRIEDSAEVALAFIRIGIEEGPLFAVDEIRITGNETTEPEVIVREARLDKGEIFDGRKIAQVRRRVERLGFFTSVSEPQLYIGKTGGGLLINVVEGSTNRFDGIIGYQPPVSSQETGFITGMVNVSFRNIFGTGRRFDARWERATRDVTELELRYLEPWVFGFPVNIQGGFFQRQLDSSYVRNTVDGKVTFLAASNISISATVQYIRVIPAATPLPGVFTDNSSTLSGGLELIIDTRDNVYNPLSGITLRNFYSGGNKSFTDKTTGMKETDFHQRVEADFSWYQTLFPRNILALSLHGRELSGSNIDASDLFRLGGARSLRGYREEQFGGTRLLWTNLEYRFSLGRRTYAFAFYDYGYVFQAENQRLAIAETSFFKGGYGLGGTLETAIGIIGVSYALGEGDSFSTGKIHFGLINEF